MTQKEEGRSIRGRAAILAMVGAALVFAGVSYRLSVGGPALVAVEPGTGVADFVEPGFPFIVTTVDARDLGPAFAPANVATRGVVLFLGNDLYATFDPDLLRMAVGWHGEFLELVTMAQISYQEPGNKDNQIPKILGQPIFTTGVYPGWQGASASFEDPRPLGPNPDDVGRGPLPIDYGRWNGTYAGGEQAILSYVVQGTEILEQPGSVSSGDDVGLARTFRLEESAGWLTLVVAEVGDAVAASVDGAVARVLQPGDSMTLVGAAGAPAESQLEVVDDRYITLRIPPVSAGTEFRVVVWRGPSEREEVLPALLAEPVSLARIHQRGPRYWDGTVHTQGEVSADTAAYVIDRITLPLENPWRRNVRPADLSFFGDPGRAAVVTFEGDVWIVSGLDDRLGRLEWRRFASGLYEPLGIEVVDDEIYVHSREGIVRLHDHSGNGEADFYENFSNLAHQSIESREFPLGFAAKPGGGFYLSRGGALDMGPRTADPIMPGFRAGSRHSGSILEVAADGRTIESFATGLREPFIGVHPRDGTVSASDQEGNYVPATPIYIVPRGGYHGVPATAHRDQVPAETQPITWIPHQVDPSGSAQVWVTDERMGLGGEALVHLSYGAPGAFRIYVDSASSRPQGAVVSLLNDFPAPLLKGTVGPHDGQLYLAGFQIWGSRATEVAVLARLRHTGQRSPLPVRVRAGLQGVLLRFATPLDAAAVANGARGADYDVRRWNYRRTEAYGSGHFMLDGSPGQERLPIAGAHISQDGLSLLFVVPDMREVMQMQVGYSVTSTDGLAIRDTVYLTVHAADELDLAAEGFGEIDWRAEITAATDQDLDTDRLAEARGQPSVELGAELHQRIGCIACHSVDGSSEGKLGPTFLGLYGSTRTFVDGTSRIADEEYLRESILEPSNDIVEGFQEGMPNYLGVLSDTEVESLVLYIRSLTEGSGQ